MQRGRRRGTATGLDTQGSNQTGLESGEHIPPSAGEFSPGDRPGTFQQLLAQLPENATVDVWRYGERTKRLAFAQTYAKHEFSVVRIREDLGGGSFQIRGVVIGGPANQAIIQFDEPLEIEGPPKTARGDVAKEPVPVAAPVAAPTSALDAIVGTGLVGMMQSFMEMNRLQMAMMQEMVQARNAPRREEEDRFFKLAELMRQPVVTVDPLDKARQIAEMVIGTNQNKGTDVDRALGMVEKLVAVRNRLREDEGDEDREPRPASAMAEVVRAMAPALKELATKAIGGAPATNGRALPPQETTDMWTNLRPRIPGLIQLAMDGKDPVVYGGVIVDSVPAVARDAFRNMLADPNIITRVMTEFPAAQSYRPWFVILLETMRRQMGLTVAVESVPVVATAEVIETIPEELSSADEL